MRCKIRVEASAWIFLSILILSVPLNWVLSAITAAAVHELCHAGMLKLLGIGINEIRVSVRGAVMDTAPMDHKRELLCTVSGPAGSFLLCFLFPFFPRIALCGLVQGTFNMLPVYPLDGGRILSCLISMTNGKIPCKRKKDGVQ